MHAQSYAQHILIIVASKFEKDLVFWIVFKMRDESPLQINLLLVHKLKSSNPIGELVIERALRLQERFSRKCDRQVIVFEIQSN